jgi:ligand-binding sensor domain-containing protein
MGVSKFNDVSWTIYTTAFGLVNNIVTSIAIDPTNNLWFGTWGGGVSKFNGTSWTSYSQANYVNVIKPDALGNIWFGTATDLKKFDGTNWTNYTTTNGLAANNVNAIAIDQYNDKWFGTNVAGVSKYNGNAFTTFNTTNGLIGDQVNCSVTESNGNIWIGTLDGVSVYTPLAINLSENEKRNTVLIFPNPVADVVKIKVENELVGLNYNITNDIGRVVLNGQIKFLENEISIDALVPGIYVFEVFGKGEKRYKIIKQ